jgi:hypothetical protein
MEEELAAAEKAVESSMVRKGKGKVAPTRARLYTVVDEPVSNLLSCRQHVPTQSLTVQPVFHAEDKAKVYHQPAQVMLQEVSDGQEPVLLEGEELGDHQGGCCHHQQEV